MRVVMICNLSDRLNRITEVVCCVILLAMTIVVALQVFCRYLLGASLAWSEEFARYSLVWITFLGASIALKKKAHMGLQALVDALSTKVQSLVETLTLIGIQVFLIVGTLKGLQLALFNMSQHSPAMGIPIGIVYMAIPAASVLMLVHVAEQLATVIRSFLAGESWRSN